MKIRVSQARARREIDLRRIGRLTDDCGGLHD